MPRPIKIKAGRYFITGISILKAAFKNIEAPIAIKIKPIITDESKNFILIDL